MRLNRYLARCGVASRRAADRLIEQGRIQVNGVVIRELATQVQPGEDCVRVEGREVRLPDQSVYLMLNKPAGYDVTRHDRFAERTVFDLLPDDLPGEVQAVGRLDRPTTGLLILTSDGELAHRLMHPRYEIEKVYITRANKPATKAQLKKFVSGVQLSDGPARALRVQTIGGDRGPPALRIVMTLGRKRIVRRLCQAVGYDLTHLHRERIGSLKLIALAPGEHRRLTDKEIEALRREVGLSPLNVIGSEN